MQKTKAFPDKRSFSVFFVVLLLWFGIFNQGIISAVGIWSSSEIFNHCFLVLPAMFWLIYDKRDDIDWHATEPSYLALLAFLSQAMLYILGVAGDISLFQHIAIFTALPTLIWFILGTKQSKKILFPLMFCIFAIPLGEELIPWLQQITADMAVYMLQMTGVPLFRSGLFIEIPQGKFLVAEACSGVSFLIASIVLGNLYAYLNLRTKRIKLLFVAISILLPILANSVRVYGIIYIGYSTDMEHAVGADHLIYGWFFFALVIVLLMLLGEFIRKREENYLAKRNGVSDNPKTDDVTDTQIARVAVDAIKASQYKGAYLAVTCIFLLQLAILLNMNLGVASKVSINMPNYPYLDDPKGLNNPKWRPEFYEADFEFLQGYASGGQQFAIYIAYYEGTKGELINSFNRVYMQERWTISQRQTRSITPDVSVTVDTVSSSVGSTKKIYYTYLIGDRSFTSKSKAKLYQVGLKIMGEPIAGSIVAVSFSDTNEGVSDQQDALYMDILSTWSQASN